MKCFVVTPGMGEHPTENGTYACEVYFGWKLLEWKDGKWCHPNIVGPWTASGPLQWIGPFPPLLKGQQGQKGAETPAPVFDL